MIQKEIRRAKQRKDWDTVLKLKAILKADEDIAKAKIDKQIAQLTLIKSQAEIRKMKYDIRISLSNVLFGFIGAVGIIIGIVKSYFQK